MCALFFFNDTATTEIYTLSLHDALPICSWSKRGTTARTRPSNFARIVSMCSSCICIRFRTNSRSEEHTSELQSRLHLVCRLLLEKKKKHESHPRPATP